ncbi:lipopolysaccharide biosynthesis protein [Actinomycetospora cinnamomea]|nr:hypothetical protein [Actinomycetospora cinnamomea]
MTGVLGLVFWFLAARFYAPADLGRGSALVSAMTLLSTVIGINIIGTLSRYLPTSGRGTARLVLVSYGLSSLAVGVLAIGFVVTVGWWGPSFDLLRDPLAAVFFVVVAVAANIFTVQDGMLVGLRSAGWVAVENTVFGLVKAVLLVVFAASLPAAGVYLSWVIPMVLLCVPVNALLFGRCIPRHARESPGGTTLPSAVEVRRFFAGDFVGALFGFGAIYLVPVVVATALEPATFAVFYVAWMIAVVLNLVSNNLAQSLTVEGVFDHQRLRGYARAALLRSTVILGSAALVLLVAAPIVTRVLGEDYASAGPLLQMLALAALARAVVEVWLGVLRALGRARSIAMWQIVSGSTVVGAVVVGLWAGGGTLGLGLDPVTGVGVLVLVSQSAVALAVLPRLLRFLAHPSRSERRRDRPALVGLQVRQHATLVDLEVRERPVTSPPAGSRRAAKSSHEGGPWWREHPVALVTTASVLAFAAFVVPLFRVDLDAMNGYGLISVLPVVSSIGLGALVLSFVAGLALARPPRLMLAAQLVAVTCCLHGVTAVLEPVPRFPTAYVHLGFVDHISAFGLAAPGTDARFSWPGFFGLVSFVSGGSGWQALLPFVSLTPLVSNLLYLLVLGMILQSLRASWRAKWFAALLFSILQWVGQDYFSPQGYTYLLYLIFIAVLLRWFRSSAGDRALASPLQGPSHRTLPLRARAADWVRDLIGRPTIAGEHARRPASVAMRITLLAFLVALFLAATVSHQLTPFVMVFAAAALVLARRLTVTSLPVLLGVLLLAWVSYMAAPYWVGHLHQIAGGAGDLSGNLTSSVAARVGGAFEHSVVVATRIALTAIVFALAIVGLWRRRRRGVDDRVMALLLGVPFLTVLVQSYGGEIGLRVYLFALAPACILTAFVLFPETGDGARVDVGAKPAAGGVVSGYVRTPVVRYLAAALAVLVLVPAFLLARYGNEAFERIRPGEIAAAQFVYDRPGDAQILYAIDSLTHATPVMPVGYTEPVGVQYAALVASEDPRDVTAVVAGLREYGRGTYFMTTRGEEQYLEINAGFTPGWGQRFREALATDPNLVKVADTGDAQVYVLRSADALQPMEREPEVLGTRIFATPWTPIGAFFLVVLVVVLGAREVWTLRRPSQAHLRWPLALLWVPLSVAVGVVAIERVLVLVWSTG